MSEVISFAAFQRQRAEFALPPGWTNSERAELYRVEAILHQSGIVIETEEGISDEGDPWFVFCRADGEVLIHIARTDGQYGFHSPALTHPLCGRSFSELCAVFQELFPVRVAVREKKATNVFLHPAAILSLVVGTIFLSFNEMLATRAEAATLDTKHPALPVEIKASEAPAAPHDFASNEPQKAIEQFQSLAAKNLKAAFGGRIEGAQNPSYAALTTSLLIFAAGSLDAATQSALADEAKSEFHQMAEPSERHAETASLSYNIGVARDHDHSGSRIGPSAEDARIVSGHMVFGESILGKLQVEAAAAPSEYHVDNANASIQFDFSQILKLDEVGNRPNSVHDLIASHAAWGSSPWQVPSTHAAEGASAQSVDSIVPEETKAQSQSLSVPQSTEPGQTSGTQNRTTSPSSHDASVIARVDTAEVLLSSLPDQLGSNLHFSHEPVKFMLDEWDKIDFGKEPTSKEGDKATGEPSPSPLDSKVNAPVPDTGHANDLSEKLNATELALYNKILGYQAEGSLSHFDLQAKNQILKFVANAADIDIIVSDHVIMFVDEAVHASANLTPYMKIWETGDGEAISIVGVTDPNHPTFA